MPHLLTVIVRQPAPDFLVSLALLDTPAPFVKVCVECLEKYARQRLGAVAQVEHWERPPVEKGRRIYYAAPMIAQHDKALRTHAYLSPDDWWFDADVPAPLPFESVRDNIITEYEDHLCFVVEYTGTI